MENKLNWSKTILSVYRYLGRITKAIDKIFDARAMGGNIMNTGSICKNNVFALTNSLINLTQRKITCINLKLLTEKALLAIDRNNARLLVKKYVDGSSSLEIANYFGYSRRTFFRKLQLALESFRKAMVFLNFDDNKISDMVENQEWILDAYKRISNSSADDIVIDEECITFYCSHFGKRSLMTC